MGGSNGKLQVKSLIEELHSKPKRWNEPAPAPATSGDFWSLFFTPPVDVLTLEELFEVVQFSHITLVRQAQPANLAMLVFKLVHELQRVVSLYDKATGADHSRAMACVHLLTRVIPPLFAAGPNANLADLIFWSTGPLKASSLPPATSIGATPPPESEVLHFEGLGEQPLGRHLLHLLCKLSFLPNFTTAPAPAARAGEVDVLWASGIGEDANHIVLSSSSAMIQRRTDVLKCLLTCFSSSVYAPPERYLDTPNRWLDEFTRNRELFPPTFFYSLLNVSCSYDPIGWGLPYNYLLFSDLQEPLTDCALQLLAVLLDHSSLQEGEENVARSYLALISRPQDFQLVYEALKRLLNNPLAASNTYLPYSTKVVDSHQEMLMLFWKFLLDNPAFLTYVLKHQDISEITIPVLYFILDARKDYARLGLVHLCTFLLLVLSSERDFAIQLNKPFVPRGKRPYSELPLLSNANLSDFLVLVFSKVLVDGSDKLDGLHECLLTIIDNLSPYLKTLSMVATLSLMRLFDKYSRPKFLFSNDRNHRFVFFLLETFNNLIQYQYEGNARLVYAVLRRREVFAGLANLKLTSKSYRTKASETEPAATPLEQPATAPVTAAPDAADAADAAAPAATSTTSTATTTATTATAATTTTTSTADGPEKAAVDPAKPFVPTEEWLQSWKSQLPLSTCLRLINGVLPELPMLIQGTADDEAEILAYLQRTTLVGILPVPHPILIRRYQQNEATYLWFHRYLWGVIFVRNRLPPLLGGPKQVVLFSVF